MKYFPVTHPFTAPMGPQRDPNGTRDLPQGVQPLHSVQLCLVGHARAGKTSTLRSLSGRRSNMGNGLFEVSGQNTRPGHLTKNYGKSPFLMGKSTINGNFQ